MIYIDDGSTDGTWEKICVLYENDRRIKGVRFSRNFGKDAAIFAGLKPCRGDCAAVIDADMQHPPEKLVEMYHLWEQGFEVVERVKSSRGKEGKLHKACANLFYKMMSAVTRLDMRNASDFKLLDRKVVNAPEMIDSHQHVHMIPAFFSCLCEIIKEDGLQTEYLRIPAEPVLPYISAPELYKSYFSLNFIKQQTLKFINLFNKSKLKSMGLKQNDFFGIMFSGNMNEKRVNRLLNAFVRHAERKNRDLELLFHPGFVETAEGKNAMKEYKFSTFYLADGRKKEFLAAKNIAKDEKCR